MTQHSNLETARPILAGPHDPARTAPCRVEFLPATKLALTGDVRMAWGELDDRSPHVYSMYQSLAWFEHLLATDRTAGIHVALLRDDQEAIVGVVPIRLTEYPLRFFAGRRSLGGFRLRSAVVLGGQPRLPAERPYYDTLFRSIWDHAPDLDSIYLKGLPADGPCWQYLQGATDGIVYAEHGIRDFYTITLPRSFDRYLGSFRRKKRYNLKRQVQLLREHGGGRLELARVEAVADVPDFLRDSRLVAEHSWQHRLLRAEPDDWSDPAPLKDLARRGLLRCYLLRAGGAPCAFVIGYQFRRVFHYADIGYDERYAHFSPGSVLLYLLIEDLIRHRPAQVLNFGIGDSDYKSQFATDITSEVSVLLLRRTAANQARCATHRLFQTVGRGVKRALPAGFSAGPPATELLQGCLEVT